MIEPGRSGHRNRAVARDAARQVSTKKNGFRLTWILAGLLACWLAGLTALAACDERVADVSETRRRRPAMRWRGTTASAPGNPFRRPARSAGASGMKASDAGPPMYPRNRSAD